VYLDGADGGGYSGHESEVGRMQWDNSGCTPIPIGPEARAQAKTAGTSQVKESSALVWFAAIVGTIHSPTQP
jgi:hypothetical protein